MTKWLTTGEMIDRLKVGEIAKKQNADTCIRRVTGHLYMYCLENGDISGFREVTLDSMVVGHKWRILPNYVSFVDAIKAFKGEGKPITNHVGENEFTYYWKDGEPMCKDDSGNTCNLYIPITETFEGKWTIEGDSE